MNCSIQCTHSTNLHVSSRRSEALAETSAAGTPCSTVSRVTKQTAIKKKRSPDCLLIVEHNIKSKKRVSFDLKQNVEHPPTTGLFQEELKEMCWYSHRDYVMFKEAAHSLARQLARTAKKSPVSRNAYHSILESAYFSCLQVSITVNPTTTRTTTSFEKCEAEDEFNNDAREILCDRMQKHLANASNLPPATRSLGLERLVIGVLLKDRQKRRNMVLKAVRSVQHHHHQQKQQQDTERINNTLMMDKDECIRRECERISRPSRLFSQCLAIAQSQPMM